MRPKSLTQKVQQGHKGRRNSTFLWFRAAVAAVTAVVTAAVAVAATAAVRVLYNPTGPPLRLRI